MEALYLLIPLSVVAVFAAAWIFLRMSDSGQFDDMDGPAWSVMHDDDRPGGEGEGESESESESATAAGVGQQAGQAGPATKGPAPAQGNGL